MPALLVFGARNLGRTIARSFSRDGWDVAGVALSDATVGSFREELPGSLGLVGFTGRAGDVERAFEETRERFGSVDLVVNAAATGRRDGSLAGMRNVLRIGGRELGRAGAGTIVQITGGSARQHAPDVASTLRSAVHRRIAAAWDKRLGEQGGGGLLGVEPEALERFLDEHGGEGIASRALVQAAAREFRQSGVHVALLIVNATIESPKTAELVKDWQPEASASEEDVVRAVAYLAAQSPRAWTHELVLTSRLGYSIEP